MKKMTGGMVHGRAKEEGMIFNLREGLLKVRKGLKLKLIGVHGQRGK
jgi:hypothetical protein